MPRRAFPSVVRMWVRWAEGFVSVTPLQLDLTAYQTFTDLNTWQWNAAPYETTLLDVPQDIPLSQ